MKLQPSKIIREATIHERRVGAINLGVGQAFQPAGSPDFPVRRICGGLESPPNWQTGMSALPGAGASKRSSVGVSPYSRPGPAAAFTMVEIAICLAIVAFAMVVIMGVLPAGMQVQKSNREDTVINLEGQYILESIRSGSRGTPELLQAIDWIMITNSLNLPTNSLQKQLLYKQSNVPPDFNTNNIWALIGLLSTPKYQLDPNGSVITNTVLAKFRSFNGSAAERDVSLRDFTFSYLLSAEIVPFPMMSTNWLGNTNFLEAGLAPAEVPARSNAWQTTMFQQRRANNLYDLRLTLRWPVRPNGTAGNNQQVFRTLVSGELHTIWIPRNTPPPLRGVTNLHYFTPNKFVN
jgi:type II secretory pathway pseudopilin PulG